MSEEPSNTSPNQLLKLAKSISLMNVSGGISRRQLLKWGGIGVLANMTGTLLYDPIGRLSMPVNEGLETLLLSQQPTPEFPLRAIEPKQLIINSYRDTPSIDLPNFRLKVMGEVTNPLSLSIADFQKLPLTSMVIRHVCVEGWAAVAGRLSSSDEGSRARASASEVVRAVTRQPTAWPRISSGI